MADLRFIIDTDDYAGNFEREITEELAERIMREEKWMLSDELHEGEIEPVVVQAFRVLQEEDWVKFVMDTQDNAALRFFNPEQREFSSAETWEQLLEDEGVPVFGDDLAIPFALEDDVDAFFRSLRNRIAHREGYGRMRDFCGGCKAFYDPFDAMDFTDVPEDALAIVAHDGGGLAPYFNLDYDNIPAYDTVDAVLREHDLWREHESCTVASIRRA